MPLLPDHLDCYVLLHVQDYRRFESPPETMVVDFARELKFVHEDRFALALRDVVLLVKYLLVYIEIEWVTTHIQVGLKPDPLLEDLSRDYALAGQKLISPELPGLGLVDPPGQLIGCLERCFVRVEIESIANYVPQSVLLDNLPVERVGQAAEYLTLVVGIVDSRPSHPFSLRRIRASYHEKITDYGK